MYGKDKRLSRIFNGNDRVVILPMDHGFTDGVIKGIANIPDSLERLLNNGAIDSIVLHKGIIRNNYELLKKKDLGLIMHMSGSTNLSEHNLKKVITGTVDEAIALGCDAVSAHINLGNRYESYMLKDISSIAEDCFLKGMPLLLMVYVRGEKVDPRSTLKNIKHSVRLANEIGADLVKVNYYMEGEEFAEIVKQSQIPVVIAGGEQQDGIAVLDMVYSAVRAGVNGVSIGRSIFQSDESDLLLDCIDRIVHKDEKYDNVLEYYCSESNIDDNIQKKIVGMGLQRVVG